MLGGSNLLRYTNSAVFLLLILGFVCSAMFVLLTNLKNV